MEAMWLAVITTGGGEPAGGATGWDWILLSLYLSLALGVSFLCSLLEASILSLPRSYVAVLMEQGKPTGKLLARMKDNLDRPLAAILTLNTIAHTIGAAGVGAQVVKIFGNGYVFLGGVVVTLLILYLSEIIPKGIGATFAKQLSPFTARTVRILEYVAAPFVWVAMGLAKLVGGMEAAHVTRDEVAMYAKLGEHAGQLQPQESKVIRNLLKLGYVRVEDIMTPRSVAFMIDAGATCGGVVERHEVLPFSRIPVWEGQPDYVAGFVLRKDILERVGVDDDDATVGSLMKPVDRLNEEASVGEALDYMIEHQSHLCVVEDEFHQVAGLVTLEDCIETMLGVEIVDETDSVEDMRALASQKAEDRRRSLGLAG